MNDIFKNVTVEQFKGYFFRDFPFLPLWSADTIYFKGDLVFYENNFYTSLTDKNTAQPTDATAWEITKGDVYNYVTNDDIQRAMSQAIIAANSRFGANDEEKINIYLHLVAFYLVMDLKNASSGVNSSYAGMVASKSVDGVSVSYNFPQWLINNPIYSLYSQNGYGMKYLSLILPYLACPIIFSRGRSTIG